MGLVVEMIWQLISIALLIGLPGSSGSIHQHPAISPSVRSSVLDKSIEEPVHFLSPRQSAKPLLEHGLAASVPAYSTNDSSPTPDSDASPTSAPPLAVKPEEAMAPVSFTRSMSLPPLMVPLPLEPPPFWPSPPLVDKQPHTSTHPMAPMPSNLVAPPPLAEPPQALSVPPPWEAYPHFSSPPSRLPNSPPTTVISPPLSPIESPPLPLQVPSHASPPSFPHEKPPVVPSLFPGVPPHTSVMPSPTFSYNASSPLPQQDVPNASPIPQTQAPPIISPPLPALSPHALLTPPFPFPSNASSPASNQVPSHASPPRILQEPPPITPSPLPAVPPQSSAMPYPPFPSNASFPLPQAPNTPPPPNVTVSSHGFAPPPLMPPLPLEPPPPSAISPYAPPRLVPSPPIPPKFITPPHALAPTPLMVPLPPEPPTTLFSPPPASAIPFPPIRAHESSPPHQLVLSYASHPTHEVPSHAFAPLPLMMPHPKEPPSLLPSPPLIMPPHASTRQFPPMPPYKSSPFPHLPSPQASPTTFLVPPPFTRRPHALYLPPPPPKELHHAFHPPSTTVSGAMPPNVFSPPDVPPPLAPAPHAVPSLPSEKSHSYMPPPPPMQGSIPAAAPPHASQREQTQSPSLPPVSVSLEPSPSLSPSGTPSIHQILPTSQPPISHPTEITNRGAPFWRSNASVPRLPPLSSPASSNTISSGVPPAVPPCNNAICNGVPLVPPPGSSASIAPPPFSSQVQPPSVGVHHSPHHSPVIVPSGVSPMPATLFPNSSTNAGSHSSAVSPSPSIHKHLGYGARSPSPTSIPLAPFQQGQVKGISPLHSPAPSPEASQKYNPTSPPSQGSPVAPIPSQSPSRAPEISPVPSKIPFLSPKISPSGSSTRNRKRPLAQPIPALPPPPPNEDCAYLTCTAPYINTPPGSPCYCVWPMQVGLRLSVALYTFFPLVSELAREIAAGISMKQSQVRIMGANATGQELEKTIVLVNLVPLKDKFDYSMAMSTSQKFWQKKVSIDRSIFGDYDVLYVTYPGLPPSPPMAPDDAAVVNSMPYSVGDPSGSKLHPLGVDVSKQRHQHKLSGSLIAVIIFSVIVVVLICGSFAWVFTSRHINRDSQPAQTTPAVPSLARTSGPTGHSNGSGASSVSLGSSLAVYTGSAKTFSARDMEKATDNFNPLRVLGEGGFGCVYHGILEDGINVAVKVLKRDDQHGSREFLAEVEMLSRLHHRNLVKLIGICIDERLRCLVYELVPNGSVDSHLHGADKETSPLGWASRLKIALGAARGLAYMHEDSSPRVIHRDFKSSNILLENDFTPKVSDFGLARTALDEENRHISTRVMGTFGYVAPEYAMTGHLLVKSDVYSYGVVLLELLTGKKPVDMSQPPGQENLVAWARPLLTSDEGLKSIIDPSLGPDVPFESVAKVAAIASMCVQPEVSNRPFMGEVVQALKLVCNECDDSGSLSRSRRNLSVDFDVNLGTSNPLQTQVSPHGFVTGGDLEKGLSVSEIFGSSAGADWQASGSLHRHSASGPVRTSRGPRLWQKIRRISQGSISERGIMYRPWTGSQ